MLRTWPQLNLITGGLSKPGKMPGSAYSIPAKYCRTGSKLRAVPGSVCADCYACKGRYCFRNVREALERRYQAIVRATAHPDCGERWVSAMAESIRKAGGKYFRWHDSGDLQSRTHLDLISEVARRTPWVDHWLPTKEYQTVKGAKVPPNLIVRVSAHMHDTPGPRGVLSSVTVHKKPVPKGAFLCPAPKQDNSCRDCRACWDREIPVIAYGKH